MIDGTINTTLFTALHGRLVTTDHDDDDDDKRRLFGAGYTALALAVVYRAVQEASAGDDDAREWLLTGDLCEALLDLVGANAPHLRRALAAKFAPVQ